MQYTCPMHREIVSDQPGTCPKCGMALVDVATLSNKLKTPRRTLKDFTPLIIIGLLIIAFTAFRIWQAGEWETLYAMRNFEGAFFIIFGLFKLLNWKGFVDAYQTYDLIAKRSRGYGYAYPLIELALGGMYLLNYYVLVAAWITLGLMSIGALGVFKELRKKNQIPCACLGVVFKIPMTWVTFIEDSIMAIMAAIMIVLATSSAGTVAARSVKGSTCAAGYCTLPDLISTS